MRSAGTTTLVRLAAPILLVSACAQRADTRTTAPSQDPQGVIVPAQVPVTTGWDVYPVPPAAQLPPVPVQLAIPSLVQGELRTGDMAIPGDSGRVGDHYILHLTAGQPVTFVARGGTQASTGSPLDMMMFLYQNHNLIMTDDDSASDGSALNPRIVYTPPTTGVYVLRVTSYGGDFRQAPYALQAYAGALDTQL
ncbi:MAG: PPC domain-containing protein [Deltaproteobacteria bacterium]